MTAQRDHLGVHDDARPSDAEREQVVRDLTKHCGDGRLTLDELEQRVAEAYAATTRLELADALRELPRSPAVIPPAKPPIRTTPSAAPVRTTVKRGAEVALVAHLYTYVSVIGFLCVIWLLTGAGYFWPIWPALSWGVAVAIQAGVTKAAGRRLD